MKRTIENCTLISKAEKRGETPTRWWYINKCEGIDDGGRGCETCRKCKYYIGRL